MLVIFDMDGVLVDSESVILKAAMAALREYGVVAQREDFRDFVGAGEDRFVGGVAEKHGVPYRVEMKQRTYEIYHTLVEEHLRVYDSTHKTLNTLKQKGFSLAVGSSADREKVEANLKTAGIAQELFDAVLTGSDAARKKPYPDLYLAAAERAGAAVQDCVVIEDAVNGIQAAKAAGMRVIGVTTSFKRAELAACGADAVVDDLWDIVDVLDKWNGGSGSR